MTRTFRFGLAAACLGVAGCSGSSVLVDYVNVGPALVDIGCRETYEVYDRPNAGTLLVRTNAFAEGIELVCASGPPGETRAGRFQRVAERHFETTKRPQCAVLSANVVSPIHAEITYACKRP